MSIRRPLSIATLPSVSWLNSVLYLQAVVVMPAFMNLLKEVKETRRPFNARVGHVTNSLTAEVSVQIYYWDS